MNSDQAHITKATQIYLQRVSCCLHSFLRSPGLPPSAATTGDFASYGHDRRDGYGYGHDLELIQNWIQNLIQNLIDMQRGTEPCP